MKAVLKAVRVVSIGELPVEEDTMALFLSEYIEAAPKGNASTEELYTRFADLCTLRKLAPTPRSIFDQSIGPPLNERFGVVNCHCIRRGGTSLRGYKGIRLKAATSVTSRTLRMEDQHNDESMTSTA